MQFKNEKKKQYSEFKVDFSKAELEFLKDYALKNIVNDENELCNYAVNKILEESVGKLYISRFKKQKKENKNEDG